MKRKEEEREILVHLLVSGKCDDGVSTNCQIVALWVTSHPLFQMTLREAGRTRIAGTYSVRFLGIKVVDFSPVSRKYG